MQAKITAPRALTKPQLPDGSTNPLFFMITDARNMGVPIEYHSDNVIIGPVTEESEFTIEAINGLVAVGCEVEAYPVFFELTATAYAKDVPAYMPNRLIEGEEGEDSTVRAWSDYKDDTHEHVVIGGKHYISSNPFGFDLPASIWIQLDSLAGVTVKSVTEYKALQPTSEDL